ncbi:MAG: CPBP family intramembrane metalloprotease [Clostridia bacterium]|nr:CPBP family intramembrane metalloprotease [Clostridia bacterium]
MKCPNCQRDNYEGAKFCLHCGTPIPQPPSRARKFFVALLKALCYFGLFFGVQTMVIAFYEAALIFGEMSGGLIDSYLYGGEFVLPESLYDTLMEQLQQNVHLLMILSAAVTLLFLFLFFQLRRKKPLEEMAFRSAPASKMGMALLLGLALQFFVTITMAFLPIPQEMLESFAENNELLHGGPLALEILSVAVVTPILEEVIFRGLVFTRLRRGMSAFIAVGVGAAIFGAAHGHIIAFVYAGCLGILLTLLMLKCGDSILVPICCHAGFNGGSYLLELTLGDGESLPLMLMFYFVSIALTVMSAYLIFRTPAQEIEE